MAHSIRAIDVNSLAQLQEIISRDPIRHCLVASRVDAGARGIFKPTFPDILGYFDDGHLLSAVLVGANVVPINTSQIARKEIAEMLRKSGRRSSSIVGPAQEVLDLWSMLETSWDKAREIRQNQPVLSTKQRSHVQFDDSVRYSSLADLDTLMPACIAMFTEEVGVSPLVGGSSASYRNRISDLILQRRSFIRTVGDEVMFKAEVGTVGAGVAQIQGVWVNPKYRGNGIAIPAMAAVLKYVLDDIAPVASLYVNDFNEAALATYFGTGFEQVDTFATILF
ncbi:MAG: GNAT family N-acetyltransferase [Actinomycetes bacterium]